MSATSIYSLIRQGLAHGRFDSIETRMVILKSVDALEKADNDNVGFRLEDHQDVQEASEELTQHLIQLLESPITTHDDVSLSSPSDTDIDDDQDVIER